MYLKLTRSDWCKPGITIPINQKDYHIIKHQGLEVFVYGYPFSCSSKNWVLSADIAQYYLDRGLHFIDDIEGVYSIIILDKTTCYVITDRYGIYSLFYTKNDADLIISDSIKEITRMMPNVAINKQSIIEYLYLFKMKLGNKTHIKDIYEFEAGTVVEINEQLKISQNKYWRFLSDQQEVKTDKEDIRNMYNSHISIALGLEEKVILPLSGGLDTRHILSACLSHCDKIRCYTHGIKDTKDVKIAKKICDHFNIDHTCYELDHEFIRALGSMFEDNAEIFNGLLPSVDFMHVKRSYEKEAGKGELFLPGILGNEVWRCLLGNKVKNAANLDELSSLITSLHYTWKNTNLQNLFKGYSERQIRDWMRQSVKNELVRTEGITDPIVLAECFVFNNWCSNWASNTLKMTGKHFKIFSAFLHSDLLHEIQNFNLKEKTSGDIQKYIISKNSRYLSEIPFDSGLVVEGNRRARLNNNLITLFGYFRSASNRVSRKYLNKDIIKMYNFLTDYPNWLRNYHRNYVIENFTYERMITKELFNKKELDQNVEMFLNGDNSLTEFVVCLMSLEIWLRKIFY